MQKGANRSAGERGLEKGLSGKGAKKEEQRQGETEGNRREGG
jgi:hypothetical protein